MFDIDGVISGEKVFFQGDEPVKSLNLKDCFALQLAVKKGYRVVVISGSRPGAMKERLSRLGITDLFFSQHDKLGCYKDWIHSNSIPEEEIVYMGDDLPDWEVMKRVGVPVCPLNSAPEIKEICIYISPKEGGEGCVRDIVEQVMRCQGKWEISKW